MSERYPGGFITKTPTAPTSSAAPGVWTLEQAMQYIKAGTWPVPQYSDPYFNYTTLLLPGTGTNGAQNNTFLDSSANNFTVTRNGGTTQGTFSPFSQTGWSAYFDGTGDYLSGVNGNQLDYGSSNFTVEFWLLLSSANGGLGFLGMPANASNFGPVVVYTGDGTSLSFYSSMDGSGWNVASNLSLGNGVVGNWVHIAIVRNGNTISLYNNGSQTASVSFSGSFSGSSTFDQFTIGKTPANQEMHGYISNLRVVIGSAIYTSNFTPPTTPLTAVAGTALLTCQSNRFVDNSTNAIAITKYGNASTQSFSPFAPTAPYSAATNGGSAFFGNPFTNASLSLSTSLSSLSVYTIEFWAYNSSGIPDQVILGPWGPNLIRTSGSSFEVYLAGAFRFNTSAWGTNQWNHGAVTCDGTTLRLYLNGVLRNTTSAVTINLSTMVIGSEVVGSTTNDRWNGYISNFRILDGVAAYTGSTYAIPTAPFTAVANTALLLNFTNAGVIDATAKNDFQTTGNAQISTTQSKFGGGSMYFDGTGDWLFGLGLGNSYGFGTGNFTIEFWAWKSANGASDYDAVCGSQSSTVIPNWFVELSATRGFLFYDKATATFCQNNTTTGINDSTWHHWAICRNNGTWYLFKDGVALTKTTDAIGSTSIPSGTSFYVGNENDGGNNYSFNGYINDLRITKGIARYTSNFTPPTAPFQLF